MTAMTRARPLPFTVLPSVVAVFPDAGVLRRRFLEEFTLGGLFVPGPTRAWVGQRVCLDVALVYEHIALQAPGVVRWKRHRAGNGLPRGIGVEVLRGRLLAQLASGAAPASCHSRARRFHVAIPVDFMVGQTAHPGVVTDISRTGVFVRSLELPPAGHHGQLRLQMEPEVTMGVAIEVVRQQMGLRQGFGARFAGGASSVHAALASMLADIGAAATRDLPVTQGVDRVTSG